MDFITAYVALVLCCMSVAQVEGNFRVLRGENQPTHEEMRMSNTPRLMQYAALSGEKATVRLVEGNQTAVVQHHVNILIDCSSLLKAGGKLLNKVEWRRQSYYTDKDGYLVPRGSEITIYPSSRGRLKAVGAINHILNITSTNILKGAEKDDNGMYSCTVCKGSSCRSASLMLFLIGAPPRVNFVEDDSKLLSN